MLKEKWSNLNECMSVNYEDFKIKKQNKNSPFSHGFVIFVSAVENEDNSLH